MLRGEVHDENASRLDGVSGHAGLFGSARDLVRFADWLIAVTLESSGGAPGGSGDAEAGAPHLPVGPSLVRSFTTRQELPPGSSRALGWDTPSGESSGGKYLAPGSFGHTGFTGTSIWIDPSRELAIVLLSNRVHPSRTNQRWGPVRALVADRVVEVLAQEPVSH
jgi:CubicO group peptidase (beta-lactamase class C family)